MTTIRKMIDNAVNKYVNKCTCLLRARARLRLTSVAFGDVRTAFVFVLAASFLFADFAAAILTPSE
jgi:hypothetical protein